MSAAPFNEVYSWFWMKELRDYVTLMNHPLFPQQAHLLQLQHLIWCQTILMHLRITFHLQRFPHHITHDALLLDKRQGQIGKQGGKVVKVNSLDAIIS